MCTTIFINQPALGIGITEDDLCVFSLSHFSLEEPLSGLYRGGEEIRGEDRRYPSPHSTDIEGIY
jgi:hypothetical protein